MSAGGGTLARELAAAGAGLETSRDPAAIGAAVVRLLSDRDALARASDGARRFAESRDWDSVARPLVRWAQAARIAPDRRPLSGEAARRPSRLTRLFR